MKKFLSIALALLMVCVMLPVVALAAEKTASTYEELKSAISTANDGDTIKLLADIDLSQTITVNKTITLNMNGKKLYNTSDLWDKPTTDNNWSLISVRGSGNLTITGNGTFAAKENDCYAVDVQESATVTIKNGTFIGNIHAVYVSAGTANVEGGTYSVQQKYPDPAKGDEFVLNCYDANRANGTARINVTGGTFKNFNPADNKAEGEGNNFADNSLVVQKNNTVQNNDYYVGNAANEVIAAASKGEEIFVLNGTTLTNVPAGVIIQNRTGDRITVNGKDVELTGDAGYTVPASNITIIVPGDTTPAETPKTEDQKNPSTGANDFVGLAAAAAVVALLGSAVVLRKK
uniref:hypothetical protein n=1 Tax=Angelakisella sp. TaxID=1935177 RepID=UPI0040263714